MRAGADDVHRPGTCLGGKYVVERVLGRGGMGVVLAARHETLGSRFALKLLNAELADQNVHVERFFREARTAATLRSPHTVRVMDYGPLEDGTPYMVMEYLEGENLSSLVEREGGLGVANAVDFTIQACEALAEAHALGLIHRDVSLKNLFLTTTHDGKRFVKVLDFGLVKLPPSSAKSLTSQDIVFGSPHYMSPEQLRSAKNVDARTDVWSLGICLYEMLAGHPPFDARSGAEVCAKILKEEVPPLVGVVPGVSPMLEAVVRKCLEQSAEARFSTIGELALALEPFFLQDAAARRTLHVMDSLRRSETMATVPEIPPEAPLDTTGDRLTPAPWGSSPERRKHPKIHLRVAMTIGLCAAVAVWASVLARPDARVVSLIGALARGGEHEATSSAFATSTSTPTAPSASASASAPGAASTPSVAAPPPTVHHLAPLARARPVR